MDKEKRQGTTSQLAEKFIRSRKKRQGTTSVVPQEQQNNVGLYPILPLFSIICSGII
jgi:hypothetical protein